MGLSHNYQPRDLKPVRSLHRDLSLHRVADHFVL
jgi:hypothetical protein